MTGSNFTPAQYEALGRLVERWASRPGNANHFAVQPEFGSHGRTMLCTVTDRSGDMGRVSIVHGIEPDGYIHT